MRRIERIVIHCTDTPAGRICTVEEITRWHKARGFRTIGYHFIVQPNGDVHYGRPIEDVGAHAKGFNNTSIGIVYAGGWKGKDTRTPEQLYTLRGLVAGLQAVFRDAKVMGHRDLDDKKLCPGFDVKTEL